MQGGSRRSHHLQRKRSHRSFSACLGAITQLGAPGGFGVALGTAGQRAGAASPPGAVLRARAGQEEAAGGGKTPL